MAKLAQFSNLRGQMEARNYGMVQPGQAFNSNQMQPPASPHLARNTSANQLQLQLDAQAIKCTYNEIMCRCFHSYKDRLV
jgi:hypothetical protein